MSKPLPPYWKASPDKWPKGGPHPDRMSVHLYTNSNDNERLNVIVGMKQARAIAAGDHEAAEALLNAIEIKATRLEHGEVLR